MKKDAKLTKTVEKSSKSLYLEEQANELMIKKTSLEKEVELLTIKYNEIKVVATEDDANKVIAPGLPNPLFVDTNPIKKPEEKKPEAPA